MTVVPPGLLHPVDDEPVTPPRAARVRRPARAALPRVTGWTAAFVVLLVLTVVVLGLTVADLAGG